MTARPILSANRRRPERVAVALILVMVAVLLAAGCLGTDQYHPKTDAIPVQCSESQVLGQDMIVNETQNNAIICASPNSSLTIELIDASRLGGEWSVTTSPGLQVSDEGITWYENGIPTVVPGAGRGIHKWNVRMNGSGLQKIKAVQKFPGREPSGSGQMFDLTIVIN
jgi:predicted secreted protein